MPSWLNLATISGVISIIAFAAEVFKVFPRYAELRRSFLLVSSGFCLGSILTAASGIRLTVHNSDSPFALLMAIAAVGAIIFLLAAVLTEATAKKMEYYWVTVGLVVAFLGLLIINAVYMTDTHTMTGVGDELTLSEKLLVANEAERSQNWQRATVMIESALVGLSASDPRAQVLNARLKALQEKQVTSDMTAINQTSR